MNANFLFFITVTTLQHKTTISFQECIDDEHFCMHDLVNFNGINEWVNEIECENLLVECWEVD